MRALLILSLGLLLTACGGSSSSSASAGNNGSETPDTSTPDTGSGDNSGDSGSSGGDSGSEGSDGDSGGTTTPDPVACNWQTPADVNTSETLGNTADAATYDLGSYSERTDLNADLTGTWVLVHKVTQHNNNTPRTTSEILQKTLFIIRDNGGQLQASVCNANGSGFADLTDTASAFELPVFSAGSAPAFSVSSNSQLSGNALSDGSLTYSDQATQAIKISSSTATFGQSSMSFGASSETNADVFCLTQRREREVKQTCAQPAQATVQTLKVLQGTDSGQQALIYGSAGYYSLTNDERVMLQVSAPAGMTVSTASSALTINASLTDACEAVNGSCTSTTGTLSSSLTLP